MRSEIEKLFHEVVDLPAEARYRHFRKHAVDRSARREVETLIAFASQSSTSLETDIGRAAECCLAQAAPVGRLGGRYRLRRALAYGGTGTVYLAERTDGKAAETVAVKLFRPDLDNWNVRPRFRSEAHILANLSHPHIVRLLESGHGDNGLPYLVMEHIDGATIEACGSALSMRDRISIFLKICSAVAYLHRKLVIHGDLKPANIMVTKAGEPKLLDFGNAAVTGKSADAAAATMRMLTPDYASPEQIAGEEITTASDIYSLGAVLYALLTGVSPQGGYATPPPSRPQLHSNGVLEAIAMKAMRSKPGDRYPLVDALADSLRAFRNQQDYSG